MRAKHRQKKVLMNKIMSSSAEFWATKHFMTPTAKHQGDWARPTGNPWKTRETPSKKPPGHREKVRVAA